MLAQLYWLFALVGGMSIWAAVIWGFRFDTMAPVENYYFNIGLYLAWAAVHLIMTRAWFKKAVFGKAQGSAGERRFYVVVSIVTWLAVLYLHRAVPGPYYDAHLFVRFLGLCGILVGIMAFFGGASEEVIKGMFAVPGYEMGFSHGSETPLMTEGSYAEVRHPLYRGALIACVSSLLLFPNAAQLLWAAMIGLTFVFFIPIEEKQLLAQRGDEYRAYMKVTRYRIIKGIW